MLCRYLFGKSDVIFALKFDSLDGIKLLEDGVKLQDFVSAVMDILVLPRESNTNL
jgi:hypothetical protein